MARIAIYGSCVTRDAFEVRPHPHTIVGYFARSSMISQCAAPIALAPEDLGDTVKEWGRRIVAADLEKTIVERIAAAEPDLVIIDLIDERLPLLRVGGSLLTVSSYAMETPLVQGLAADGTRLGATATARNTEFLRTAPMVMARLLEVVGPERILLHRAMYSMRVQGRGRFDGAVRASSRRMNRRLGPWYDAVARASGCREFRPPRRARIADPGHKWGLSPFHYVQPYYERLLDEVDRMGATQAGT